jgi:uncharacterized protein with ParB-like and HNH nuclease domain
MEVSKITLHELLEGARQYKMPPFQRKYSWDEKNWNMLWEDLIVIYNGEIESDYFMGTIVTKPMLGSASGVSPFIVIDGQQRLITITILLAAIRNLLEIKGNIELSDKINKLYLVNDSKGINDYHKISFRHSRSDWSAYKSIMDKSDYSVAHTKASRVFKLFEGRLSKLDSNADLEKLKNIIVSKLIFIDICVDDEDNPYLIFGSLNNKGLQLEQSDLIRSHIFMRFSEIEERVEMAKEWHLLEDKFAQEESDEYVTSKGLLSLDQYFWIYLRKDGISVPEKEVSRYMISDFDKSPCKYQYIKELNQFSNYYVRFCSPEKEHQGSLSKYFSNFLKLNFRTCHIENI